MWRKSQPWAYVVGSQAEWGSTHTGSEIVGPLLCVDPACLRAGASPGPHGRAEGTAAVQRLPLGPAGPAAAGAGNGSEEV